MGGPYTRIFVQRVLGANPVYISSRSLETFPLRWVPPAAATGMTRGLQSWKAVCKKPEAYELWSAVL